MANPDLNVYEEEFAVKKLLPFYERIYFFEIDRKNSLRERLNFPVSILILTLGVTAYFFNNLPTLSPIILLCIFYLSLFLLIMSQGFTLYFLIRSIFRYKYRYISNITRIDTTIRSLKKYNDSVPESKRRNIEQEFAYFLIEQYQSAASINSRNNNVKTGYLFRAMCAIVITVVILIISVFLLYLCRVM